MTSVTLFMASWCGHCKAFEPTWEKVKAWCKKKGIDAKEYEDSQIQVMQADPSKNNTGIPLEMIEGYPTIIIKRGAGDFAKVGDRSKKNIIKMLGGDDSETPKSPTVQKGGSCDGNSCSVKKQSGGSCEGEICGSKKQQENHFGEMSCSGNSCTIKKQTGGSTCGGLDCSNVVRSAEFYKAKYLTYKNKYMALKQELHM